MAPEGPLTTELSEDFENGRLPTLDLNLEIIKVKAQEQGENLEQPHVPQVKYTFYMKPSASPMCMLEQSAMPQVIKDCTLSQELIRRHLNCSEHVSIEERIQVTEEYSSRLRVSGYSLRQRRQALVAGLVGYHNRVQRSKQVGGPKLHRNGATGKANRRLDKLNAKSNWHMKPRSKQGAS